MAGNVQMSERTTSSSSRMTDRERRRMLLREKQERKRQRTLILVFAGMILLTGLLAWCVYYFVFRSHDYSLTIPYDKTSSVFGFQSSLSSADTADSFAADLCVTDMDVNENLIEIDAYEGALFDLTNRKVDYAKDIFTSRSPASMTKVMTALIALKYGNLDSIVTVTDTAYDIEYGSSVCDIKTGDQISLKQLLYGLLIASGNDAAMMIAEYVGGSVDQFVDMMNEEALSLGATGTHFENPHGLTAEGHYTTAYDMYLIFKEAMKYDVFMDIINRSNYYAEYTHADGSAVAVTWESTDHYLTGEAAAPDNVIIYGGKTGTTEDAGACLVLLSKDLYGDPFVSVIMHSSDKEQLYVDMNQILSLIPS